MNYVSGKLIGGYVWKYGRGRRGCAGPAVNEEIAAGAFAFPGPNAKKSFDLRKEQVECILRVLESVRRRFDEHEANIEEAKD